MEFCLFDTETTGLLKPSPAGLIEQPEIIEIYCAVVDEDFNFLREYESFFKPLIPIDSEIERYTGISNEMVSSSPSFLKCYPKFSKFMTGVDVLVAHNISFDTSMLANELLRIDKLINFPWPRHHICTVQASKQIKGHRLKLADLCELAGKPLNDAHRARNDVRGLYNAFKWLVNNNYIDLKRLG